MSMLDTALSPRKVFKALSHDNPSPYRTLDPSTGELLESFELATEAELGAALVASAKAFQDWRKRPLKKRLEVLTKAADLLDAEADAFAAMMATEMGKPLAQGRGEAQKCAWVCRYYAEHSEAFLRPVPAQSDASEAYIRFDPLGTILAIMPWNFPFWQVFRFAAPSLAAGNVAILKHAPNTPRCAAAIADIFTRAGAPEGVFQNLYLSNEQAAQVIEHDCVRGVTLTGSTRAGRSVAGAAGHALKPMVMELGGSDPFMVFADADLDSAVAQGVTSRCLNSGQSCIAAKRFLVEHEVLGTFLEKFTAAMKAQKVGDPKAPGIDLGPLARQDLRDQLAKQVEHSYKEGAIAVCGGESPSGEGFFYPPTVLTGLAPDTETAQQELFGPVAIVHSFASESDALNLANATDFGLGASLWTEDRGRIERLVPEIDSGSVFVNGFVKSDPRLPFGGVKQSGFGRELARDGMMEFVNVKTVWIK